MLGVCEDSITGWENNRSEVSIPYYPKIINFLGYIPFKLDTSTLGGQIKLYRYLHGLTQKELAYELAINESTLYNYERGKHKVSTKIFKKLETLLHVIHCN